jgi:hypothetical protein
MDTEAESYRSTDQISSLSRSLLDDIFKDFNSSSRRRLRKVMEPFVYPSAKRFARIATLFDFYVEHFGLREAMKRILPYFISDLQVRGVQHVPDEGPLLVVSNHPGAYDSLAIAASLPRTDLKIVASGFPILRRLPFASRHLIFVSADIKARMMAVRSAIRHLREGGAVLIFPSGRVDPDPACLPGAPEAMSSWSSSVELFLKKIPQVRVLPTIVSGVLSPKYLSSPFIRFWRGLRDPQTTAEVIQVIIQMLFPQKVQLVPKISFGSAKTMNELHSLCQEGKDTLNSIVEEARRLLTEHRMWIDDRIELPDTLYE